MWKVDKSGDFVFDQDGNRVCLVMGLPATEPPEAKARLIAAAPAMIEALQAAKLFYEDELEGMRDDDEAEDIRAEYENICRVIEQATGETPSPPHRVEGITSEEEYRKELKAYGQDPDTNAQYQRFFGQAEEE